MVKFKEMLIFITACFNVYGKQCKTGKACGDSCISWNKTCRLNSFNTGTFKTRENFNYTGSHDSYPATYIVTASKLNVRENPFSTKEIVGSLEHGQEVTVVDVVYEWAMVIYNGKFHWVSKKYLKFIRK